MSGGSGLGPSNAGIAARLHRSVRTVEHHVAAVLAKTRTGSRAELIAGFGAPAGINLSWGFKVFAGGDGVKQQAVGCLATEREIYNDLPPQLRWGDFEDSRLGTFEEIRDAFSQVANAPVALEGAAIEVSGTKRRNALTWSHAPLS